MPLEHRFTCPLPNGIHARPASHLEALASRFASEITLVNERSGYEANAKSVLALLSADIHLNDPLVLRVAGSDADAAFDAINTFLLEDFLTSDEPLPVVAAPKQSVVLPRSLRAAAAERILTGTILSPGVARGVIKQVKRLQAHFKNGKSSSNELTRFNQALAAVDSKLTKEIESTNGAGKSVLQAHLSLLNDRSFTESVTLHLGHENASVGDAILAAVEQFSAILQRSTGSYLQERALDLQDVGARLLSEIYGSDAVTTIPKLDRPSIVVAESLTPGQFLGLERRYLRGLVLEHSGATSHTVILARSFGLPILVGVAQAVGLADEIEAILDANLGLLIPGPNAQVNQFYQIEERRIEWTADRARAYLSKQGASKDGRILPVLANAASVEEVSRAIEQGAEGIGLFRTEMIFMDRSTAPSEEEQTEIYKAAVIAANGRPVTFRTFDIGGDKPIPYMKLPEETNPFLGYRGIRLYEQYGDLLKAQLRSLCRSAKYGPIQIMAPMVACPEEMAAFRAIVEEINESRLPLKIGTMIEVPSSAFAIAELAQHADFFSLGTNDLMQYFLAVDRDNAHVAELSSPFHPSFLRFLKHIIDQVHAEKKPIGLCGELAGNPEFLSVLLGLDLDSISLGATRVPATKTALAQLDHTLCRTQVADLLTCRDRNAVKSRLADFRLRGVEKPLLSLDLIEVNPLSKSKHEVIKELTTLLAVTDRVFDATALEEAIWQREETYSTGFGHGFAVPHCQSEHVKAGSLAVVRLPQPIEWGSLDGEPVRVAILLALRPEAKGGAHLRIFAKLSRLLMSDEFRLKLDSAADAQSLFSVLETELR